MSLTPIPQSSQVVDGGGYMTQIFRNFLNTVARLSIMTGSGSPNGVIEARATRLYMDTAGSAGNILYIKQVDSVAGDKTQGWVLV